MLFQRAWRMDQAKTIEEMVQESSCFPGRQNVCSGSTIQGFVTNIHKVQSHNG